ncbi:MAG: DUF1553 domain-containing protein [Fuerstiella sp.]|jgi:mono/diheme cytochrome c family protein|nr:DUF1553 domain-containing protein [Fuerstiella sp.]MDG2130424.1 PSD1 and planctomycete cytochrome C domain-containing protein [Fuerstiella sp.]
MILRLFATVLWLSPASLPATASDPSLLTFEKDVRPIFRAHCYDCHGATEDVKGGLDLRLVRFMQKGGESGAAIAPGVPGDSYLLDRLRNGEMPPGEHRVPDAEILIIERWIAAGARTARPEPETIPPGLGLTPEERGFWSFLPIRRPEVPDIADFPRDSRVRTPIDALVLKSMPQDIGFSPDVGRRTLIKRAYFDLIGLPPSPEELQTWAEDTADDWYDRLLTDLLDSHHYGERWGRHWLDVAGYADSEGYTNSDAERPWSWKYRDWVIRALNEDKSFDRFITEQLAGDELAGPQEGDLTAGQTALLTATGFLRMAADGTGSGANDAVARNKVMADTLQIVGTSLLGLSIQCAQCHDHRYDPIPHTDYYALRAVFEPALDWQAWKVPNARRVSLYTKADREKATAVEAETKVVADERATRLAAYMKQAVDAELMKFPEPLRGQLRGAYETAGDKRTEEQKKLLAQNPSVNISPGNLYQYIAESKPELAKFDARIKEIRAKKPVEEFLRVLSEPSNHVPETKLFFRGDHEQPKQTLLPASLTVTAPEGQRPEFAANSDALPSTGRRLAFAKWLTNGRHPLVARVIANRAWLHHFGKGLVETPADFGRLGVRPSHPELLDWLADEFMRQGWSLKKLHRQIMTSTVWRQSADVVSDAELSSVVVPFARRTLTRLDAETIRDRMLAASGQLDRTPYGAPVGIKEDDTGQVIVDGSQTRRSLYIKARRSRPVAMLQAFDAPVMQTNCEMRQSSTVATQSLMLMNGEFTLEQAGKLAARAAKEAIPLDEATLAALPKLTLPAGDWQYGFGAIDETTGSVMSFTKLTHFTGSQWQAGPALPDPQLGYVLLHANGGHPDVTGRAVIRRWTASTDGTVAISGKLSHGSANGNGVRSRVVSSRSGKAGEWLAFNGATDTNVTGLTVQKGDTIDFVTDANGTHTSDSFTWPVSMTVKSDGQPDQAIESVASFSGPRESSAVIAGQIIRAWELALCRTPTNDELRLAVEFAAAQMATFNRNSVALPAGRTPARQAIVSLCQSFFSSNEFLYVE